MSQSQIILAITGGVAAYKAAMLASSLAQAGYQVRGVMTPSAQKFLGTATIAALTGQRVVTETFDSEFPLGAHIELARQSTVLCVVPATANFLAKAASGLSDDLISTLYLCFTGPVIVAPAMNCEMWEKPVVARNVQRLRDDGVVMVDPEEGWLSCRTKGVGRMAAPSVIEKVIVQQLNLLV